MFSLIGNHTFEKESEHSDEKNLFFQESLVPRRKVRHTEEVLEHLAPSPLFFSDFFVWEYFLLTQTCWQPGVFAKSVVRKAREGPTHKRTETLDLGQFDLGQRVYSS